MPDSNGNIADALSRRALVWSGSAAVLSAGLGGARPAADAGDRSSGADRRLSLAFRWNAEGFYRSAVASQVRFPDISLHSLAIAIELSLKAYLLHRGVSDDWNRLHIGHDLCRALACAKRVGFCRVPGRLPDLAAGLTPCYERHGFSRRVAETLLPQLLPQACDTVGDLLRSVAGQIDHETASEDRIWRLRQEGARA
jgi:hypothetical protein